MATCRECKLYDLDATRSKSGAILKNRAARCLWKSRETWPASVMPELNSRARPGYMRPDDGARCQTFQKRGTP